MIAENLQMKPESIILTINFFVVNRPLRLIYMNKNLYESLCTLIGFK